MWLAIQSRQQCQIKVHLGGPHLSILLSFYKRRVLVLVQSLDSFYLETSWCYLFYAQCFFRFLTHLLVEYASCIFNCWWNLNYSFLNPFVHLCLRVLFLPWTLVLSFLPPFPVPDGCFFFYLFIWTRFHHHLRWKKNAIICSYLWFIRWNPLQKMFNGWWHITMSIHMWQIVVHYNRFPTSLKIIMSHT